MHAYRCEYPTFRELAERADRAFRTLDQLDADIEALQFQREEARRSVSHLGGLVSRAIHDTARELGRSPYTICLDGGPLRAVLDENGGVDIYDAVDLDANELEGDTTKGGEAG